MLSPSYGRHAPPIRPSPSLEGLERVIPPTSPLTIAGRPYYLQLDKPLPEKPPQEETPSMYTAAWSIDSSTIGSSSRCSSRESSRYSTDSYPIFVSSGSDNGTGTTTTGAGTGTGTGTGKIRDRRPSDGPGDGSVVDDRTLGSASIDAATKTKHVSLDPLEVFLADHDHDHDHDHEDEDEDRDEDEDDEKRHGLEIRHTVTDWTQNRYGPNHYFREKKWDFFPELATPGALPGGKFPSGRPASTTPQTKTKTGKSSRTRNLSTFDFGRLNGNRGRGNTLDLAQNVRDSIKSVQRKLSNKPSSLEKEKARQRQQPRPSTARSERYGYGALSQRTATTPSSQRTGTTDSGSRNGNGNGSTTKPPNYEDIFTASDRLKRTLSAMSTRSSIMASPQSLPLPRRPKPLAIPLSPYQKYGAAIWEKSSRGSMQTRHRIPSHNVRFPRYYQNRRRWSSSLFSTSSSSSSSSFPSTTSTSSSTSSSDSDQINRLRMTQSNPDLPVSIPLRSQLHEYMRALQDGTSSMLGAIDGAKRRVIDSRMDRRRAQLKARIRLVGPVDPYTAAYGRGEAWV